MMSAYTDFLTYSEGVYYPSQGAFKFNGQNIVKIIGWGSDVSGDYWIVQGAWGESWGTNGYAKVMAGKQEIGIDLVGIAPVTVMQNFAEYQKYVENYRENQESEIPRENIRVVDDYEEKADI